MNFYNFIYGPIIVFIGVVLFFKKLDIVKSSMGEKRVSPLLINNEDGTQELVLGVKIVFNIIGLGFILGGIGAILSGVL